MLDEAKALVEGGAKEITLLGQNVNAWSGEDNKGRAQGLDGLIRALDRIDGLHRIRYMTSHPADMTDGLIAAHGDVEKLMPYLHLPVQAGFGSYPQGYEPQPYGGKLFAHPRPRSRCPPRHSDFRRFHCRFSRRK